MYAPVIQHLRVMQGLGSGVSALHFFDDTQKQVVILRTVASRALTAHSLKQFLFEHRQVADVVDGHQVFGREVGLEVPDLGAFGRFFKQGFVAVHKVGIGFGQQFARTVRGMGGQQIVVVSQRKVGACGQLGGGVGVGGNALIFDFGVDDARFVGGVFPHDLRYLGVVGIAGVRQHKLPVGGGLPDDAFNILAQEVFRRVEQRCQDADGGKFWAAASCRWFCRVSLLGR